MRREYSPIRSWRNFNVLISIKNQFHGIDDRLDAIVAKIGFG